MAYSLKCDELVSIFAEAEKPVERFLIGAESEKFGVHSQTGAPLMYEGEFSVAQVIRTLCEEFGWTQVAETEGGPVLGARRGGASVTLEPGAQFELSGDALPDLHQVAQEAYDHLREISGISHSLDITWLATGFHPLAQLSELPWVPKQRYPIMRSYLPGQGPAGLDMMQRTCTTQGNFDWLSESDGMQKLRLALKLSPLLQAWFSNAPFREGRATPERLSHRGVVWQNMDPSRSGLIEALWKEEEPKYEDYVQWSLDAGMFLFRRGAELIKNTGQTFRDFMANGFAGHHATVDDYRLHLTTLFPEVRLKNTLEVRSVDALTPELSLASLGVWTGLLYDQEALNAASALVESWTFSQVESARAALCDRALAAPLCGRDGFAWAESLIEIARGGLTRRARKNATAQDESVFLVPAQEILELRAVPAERALRRFAESGSLIEATKIPLPTA